MSKQRWSSIDLTNCTVGDPAGSEALAALPDFSLEFSGTFSGRDDLLEYLTAPPLPAGYRPMWDSESPRVYGLISTFRYKPGWSFRLMVATARHRSYERYVLVRASVPHRDRPLAEVTIEGVFMVPPHFEQVNDRSLWEWLRSVVWSMESHEADEWFVVDGVRVFDPHAQKETPDDTTDR